MKTALLFSGQGSQYVGMMQDLYQNLPTVAQKIDLSDKILKFELSSICFNGPVEKLKETRYTQPAIFMHSAILFDLLKEKIEFSCTAGHSVGEYAALYAAGVLSYEDALKLVALRGKLMFEAGVNIPGTMFAVINLADDQVEKLCNELTEKGNGNVIVAANYNSPGQVVISGSAQYLRENAVKFKEAGARMVMELTVSGAFHSPLMLPAKESLEKAINEIEFNDASVPVYCNISASPVTKASELKEALIKQLISPVLWSQTLQNMYSNGIDNYIEIGPGNVLQGLVKRTLQNVNISGFDKYSEIEKYQ